MYDNDTDFWGWFGRILLATLTALSLVFVGTIITCSLRSDGKVDFCYAQRAVSDHDPARVTLYGHIPWRSDINMGNYPTIFDASNAASTVGCSFK
jgi:hypothetical protein